MFDCSLLYLEILLEFDSGVLSRKTFDVILNCLVVWDFASFSDIPHAPDGKTSITSMACPIKPPLVAKDLELILLHFSDRHSHAWLFVSLPYFTTESEFCQPLCLLFLLWHGAPEG